MAASYISVPRDLTKVKSKVMFNLTKRQLICFSVAALIGVPSFFLLKSFLSISAAAAGMMVIMMIDAFSNFYNEEYQARADELGLNPRQVLIIASMIEKETTVEKERAAISAVIHNRYNLGLMDEDEIPKIPLCSPSEESIIAALYPEEADYTHYVLSSKLDGTHKFTADDAEYEKLSAEYEEAVKAKEESEASDKAAEEIKDSEEGGV